MKRAGSYRIVSLPLTSDLADPLQTNAPDIAARVVSKMSTVRMPDGALVAFPDDMPADQIRGLIQQKFPDEAKRAAAAQQTEAVPLPNPRPAAADDTPNANARALQIGTQGSLRAVADTVGMLPDITNMGANAGLALVDQASRAVGGPEISFRFPMVSDEIAKTSSRLAKSIGVPVVDEADMSGREKLGYNINRFGTQGALTAGILSSLSAARNAETVARAAPRFGDSLLRPYAESAGRAAVGDTAAGAGAGAALTASEAIPEPVRSTGGGAVGVGADLLAMLLGGFAGGTAAGVATRGPNHVKYQVVGAQPAAEIPLDRQTGLPTSNRIADRTADFVQSQSIDPEAAAERVRKGANSFRDMGAPVPTSGLLSEDPKLIALERQQRGASPGEYAAKDIAIRDAAREAVDNIQPQGVVDPRDATKFIEGTVSQRIRAAAENLNAAQQRHAAADQQDRSLADVIRANGGRGSQASADLDRLVVDRALIPAQNEKNQRYRDIDPDRSVMRNIEPMASLADDIERQVREIPQSLAREMVPQRLMDEIRGMRVDAGGTGTMSFGAMTEMRSGLASAALAARTAGQTRLAENLDRFRAMIGQEGQALASEGSAAGQRAHAAAQFYRDEFAPVWNSGPGDEAARFRKDFNVDRINRTTTPPSTTAGRFLTTAPGAAEKAASLSRVVDSLPDPSDRLAAMDAVRRFVLDDMARAVGADGRIQPQNLARWLNGKGGWGDALAQFPTVRGELETVLRDVRAGNAAKNATAAEVERAAAGLTRTRDEIDRSALSLVIGREPKKAARAVLESRDPQVAMREVAETIGSNATARVAWERAVTDHLVDRITKADPASVSSGVHAIDYGKLVNTFGRYEGALGELYAGQPEKMQALRRAQKMLEPLARIPGPSSHVGADVPANEQAWRALEIGLKGFYGVLKGGGVLRTLRIALKGADDTAQVERLVTRMMFDPELASHLLTRKTQDVGAPAWNEKLATLLRRVEAGRNLWGDETESD